MARDGVGEGAGLEVEGGEAVQEVVEEDDAHVIPHTTDAQSALAFDDREARIFRLVFIGFW